MTIKEELLELEEKFWKLGADFYEARLTDDCLMIFPSPIGMLARDAAIATVAAGPRWDDVAFGEVGVRQLADTAVTLTYCARARRRDLPSPYSARAMSAYVKRNGMWKLAVHQQTPNPDD